jgi:uncharacterized protein YhfF
MEDGIGTYWREFLETLEGSHRVGRSFSIWGFGDSPEMADKLGALVKEGVKTATCSLLWEYEFDNEKLPAVGELSIITDGLGAPMCIIETTEVEIKPYDQVDETFAYDEGEGDRSLAYWRKVHWHFFGRSCERIGRDLRQDMPLICERFHLIYTES